jgi:hypothetical protein
VSEFGKGIVVCLAKFSEHLHEHGPYSERSIREYAKTTDAQRTKMVEEAGKFPRGDSAQTLSRLSVFDISAEVRGGREEAISSAIEMWMNAASDHFYDLDDRAPPPLRKLADLALRIGHGFTGETWTLETVDEIRDLWRESCLAVDQLLGVEPDWGKW